MELVAKKKVSFLPAGFAIFSMFFGAGNSIFPLLIGSYAGDKNIYAVMGLFISAIIVPLLGLIAIGLFKGDYKEFFNRIGKIPGFALIAMIMIVIGPFAGIPRCITLSYSTFKPYLGQMPLITFSIVSCVLMFLTTFKRRRLVDILGKILTPLLLFCLAVIIIKGVYASKAVATSVGLSNSHFFLHGLTEGYQMMDLLASFFFSAAVLAHIQTEQKQTDSPLLLQSAFYKAILTSAALLAIIYLGFSSVAANQSQIFQSIPKDALLGAVSNIVLGENGGFIMAMMVALACLTTAITLVSVFGQFLYESCLKQKVPYVICLMITIGVAFCFSTLGFNGICKMMGPILTICYPGLITLTVLNILYKLYDFKPVKWPVYSVFALSLLVYLTN